MNKTYGKERTPPCEQCWPGIDERNVNAWDVYQMANLGSMGMTPMDVLSVCDVFEIKEKDEVLFKIRLLVGYLSELEGEK